MEDDQQFCLRWNNHQTTLIQNFDTLLESGTLVDCTLAAEGKYLKAHKVVLSACSPYFEGLLSEHYDKHPVFILKDVKFKELKAMMDYMYRGEVNISQDQLAALLKAAESLQIKGLSESRTGGNGCTKPDTRQGKASSQSTAPSLDIPHASSGLTIEKNNKVPRQSLAQSSVGDLPEDSASPSIPKGISSREGSQSPVSRKRKRLRRRSVGEDNSVENHESNSSDMTQTAVPTLGVAPVVDEKSHADPADSLGRSALMQQLTKPADDMLQLPVEKPEPTEDMIQPKSEYLDDPEESVEDLTLDDDMNDLNEMEDSNRAGPSSHDPNQHPGLAAWHVTGDRSNAGGVGGVAGGPGAQDEVFLAAHEAVQAQRDSQGYGQYMFLGEGDQTEIVWESINISDENMENIASPSSEIVQQKKSDKKAKKLMRNTKQGQVKYLTRSRFRAPETLAKSKPLLECPNKCGNSFLHQNTLDKHLKFVCGQQLRYKCPYCDMSSRIRNNLNIHINARHPEFKNYVIDLWTGKTEPRFEEDFDSPHIDQVEHSWNEEHEIKILSVSSLAKVEDIKHEYEVVQEDSNMDGSMKRKRFICPNNCGNSYKHEHTLKVHMEFGCNRTDFHLDDDESDSEYEDSMIDDRKAENPDELLNPLATREKYVLKQNSDGKWVCPNKCGGTFSSRGNLNYHLRTHCGQEPKLECPYCFHRMKQASNGFTHVKNHHPGANICLVNVETGEVIKRKKETDLSNSLNLNSDTSESFADSKSTSNKSDTTCPTCGKEFKLLCTLSRHLAEGCGYPPRFKCPYCDYRVRRLYYAFFHVSKHHPGCEVYMIDLVTGNSITDPAQIKKEAITEMVEDKKPVVDPQSKQIAKSHPSGIQKKKLFCPKGCGHYFSFRPALQKHIKHCRRKRRALKTSATGRFKCPHCDHRYEHRSSILRHIKARHQKLKRYAIDTHEEEIVPESTTSQVHCQDESLNAFVKVKKLPMQYDDLNKKTDATTKTAEFKGYPCPNKCGGTFQTHVNVNRHIRLNCVKARRFKCPQCNYRSSKFLLIGKHIKSNHKLNKIYAVDVYTKELVYSEPRRRARTLKVKNEESELVEVKPDIPQVSVVPRGYKVPKDHLATLPKTTAKRHSIQRRFSCPNGCGRSFNLERHLEAHLTRICGKEPRFKCPYCTQICRHQGNVTIHIKHRHPGKRNYTIDTLKKKPKSKLKKATDNSAEENDATKVKVEESDENMTEVNPAVDVSETRALYRKAKRKPQEKATFNYKKRRYMCPNNCGCMFQSLGKLRIHKQTVCKKALIFKCPYCSKICKFSWNIDMHIKYRHPEHLRDKVKTEEDSKNLNVEENVKNEENMEQEENNVNKTEELKEYSDSEDVEMKLVQEDDEMKLVQEDDENVEAESSQDFQTYADEFSMKPISPLKTFPCPNKCGSSYLKEISLKNHLKYTCQKPEVFKCPYCNNRTKQTSNGYAHVRKEHPDREIYLINTETNKIVCGSRLQQPTLSSDITENEDLKNSDSVENNDDNEGAIANEDMEILNDSNDFIDEPDEPDEPIMGNEEDFATDPVVQEKSLDEKEETFICPNNCGSSFTHEHKLTNHVRDQCGPPRYKCPYCFYITRQPSNVYTHIQNKHPDERIYMIDTDMNQSCNEPGSPPGNEEN